MMAVNNYKKHQRLHTFLESRLSNRAHLLTLRTLVRLKFDPVIVQAQDLRQSLLVTKTAAAPCLVAANEVKLDQMATDFFQLIQLLAASNKGGDFVLVDMANEAVMVMLLQLPLYRF